MKSKYKTWMGLFIFLVCCAMLSGYCTDGVSAYDVMAAEKSEETAMVTNSKDTIIGKGNSDNKNKDQDDKSKKDSNNTGSDNNECVKTNILGNSQVCNDENGNGIKYIFDLVVSIMSIGVGILGVLGIMICGIQYLTSSGDEAKATKAKKRLFEIVIGLAVYAVLFTIKQWLLG